MADRRKLMSGSEDLNKPTAKAMARFEELLSKEEKTAIYKEMKMEMTEHQVESLIRATVKKNPAFLDKILKKKANSCFVSCS